MLNGGIVVNLSFFGKDHAAGFSVEEWIQAVRGAKAASSRVFVGMCFFRGEGRNGDIQSCLEDLYQAAGMTLLFLTVDLATDSRWDISDKATFYDLMQLATGFIDLVIGAPPCSTVSIARFNRLVAGPRPLRFRSCFWEGRPGLSNWEQARVGEANLLYLHWLSLAERVCSHGGFYLHEHPKDPGRDPFPSLYATPEFGL